jgi:hypothetical protein
MKPFTSHDGTDENNVRAEVYVQINEGIVDQIKDGDKGTSDVYFKVENLKFPVHGWVGQDDAVYELAKVSLLSKEPISFRIESQRKKKVDRTIPIAELRASTEMARENTTPILAGINGVLSKEAITNPNEDPKPNPSGRLAATDDDMKSSNPAGGTSVSASAESILETLADVAANETVADDIVAGIAAQALIAGASITEVQKVLAGNDRRDPSQPELKSSFTVESPAWKDFNSDGRLNYGSFVIQSGVHVESFVRSQVTKRLDPSLLNDPTVNDAVEYFSALVLAIADRVQVSVYGEGFRADRAAASHTKARSIVNDTINKYYDLPLSEELTLPDDLNEIDAWIKNVGKLSVERFRLAARRATDKTVFGGITPPISLLSEKANDKAEEAEVQAERDEIITESENIAEEVVLETPEVAEETVAEAVVADEVAAEEALDDVAETEGATESADEDGVVLMPPAFIEGKVTEDKLAKEQTVKELQAFVQESEVKKEDLIKLTKLISYTFGPAYKKATLLDDDSLADFIDFYVASGSENFIKALDKVSS